jgi:ribosomal protein S18 acetylase RimI-like enzyme
MNLKNNFEIKAFDSKTDTIDQMISCVCPFRLELVNFFGPLIKTKHVIVRAILCIRSKKPMLYISAVQECGGLYELDVFISENCSTQLIADMELAISGCLGTIFESTSGFGKQLFIETTVLVEKIKHLFLAAGMRFITTFSELSFSIGNPVPNFKATRGLQLLPFCDFSYQQANELFQRSSINSLDCPEGLKFRNVTKIFDSLFFHPLLDANGSLVAMVDSVMAGFVMVVKHEDQAEIAYLGVAEECRSRGVGSALIGEALLILARGKVKNLTVIVDEGNFPALNLYLRFGMILRKKRILFLTEG